MDENEKVAREFTRAELNRLRLVTRDAIRASEDMVEALEAGPVTGAGTLDAWALQEERRLLAELRAARRALR
jgi:hypothetical protein